MKRSLYREWMVRLQMFLAARETRPNPNSPRARSGEAQGAA